MVEPEPELITTFPPNVPPKSALLAVHMDTSKRVSTCHICTRPIPKGKRLIFTQKLAREIRTQNGGKMWQRKSFAHPECMIRDQGLTALWAERDQGTMNTVRPCWECGVPIEMAKDKWKRATPTHRCFTGRRYQEAPLCESCCGHPWWEMCGRCCVYNPTARMLAAYYPETGVEFRACRDCVDNGGYGSVLDLKRERRLNDRLEARFEALRAKLEKELHAARPADRS